jgi:hypothetical protein
VDKFCRHHRKDEGLTQNDANGNTYSPYRYRPNIPRTERGKPCKLCMKGTICRHHK